MARCFSRDIIDDAANQLLVTDAQREAEQRLAFESAVLAEHTLQFEKKQSDAHTWDWVGRPPRATIVEMWGCGGYCDRPGCTGHVDPDDEPGEAEFAELRTEQSTFRTELATLAAQLDRTRERFAAALARAKLDRQTRVNGQRQKEERWLQMLRRTEKLLFTAFCPDHMSVFLGDLLSPTGVADDIERDDSGAFEIIRVSRGRIARPRAAPTWHRSQGNNAAAICAEHRMMVGIHRAEFKIGKCDRYLTVGILHADHHPRAHNHGREAACKGAFCGRPTDTKSAWGYNSSGAMHHRFEGPTQSLGLEPFGDGDTVRLELNLDGEWGGHVIARMGNRVSRKEKVVSGALAGEPLKKNHLKQNPNVLYSDSQSI